MKEIKGLEGIFNSEDVNKFVVLLDSSTDFLAAGFIRNYSVKKNNTHYRRKFPICINITQNI